MNFLFFVGAISVDHSAVTSLLNTTNSNRSLEASPATDGSSANDVVQLHSGDDEQVVGVIWVTGNRSTHHVARLGVQFHPINAKASLGSFFEYAHVSKHVQSSWR